MFQMQLKNGHIAGLPVVYIELRVILTYFNLAFILRVSLKALVDVVIQLYGIDALFSQPLHDPKYILIIKHLLFQFVNVLFVTFEMVIKILLLLCNFNIPLIEAIVVIVAAVVLITTMMRILILGLHYFKLLSNIYLYSILNLLLNEPNHLAIPIQRPC